MVTLNSDTCDKISVFCAACAGVVPGAAIGAAAFAIPPMIKHLRRASSLEKLLQDTSKEIKDNVGEWTRQSKEYKPDELASAEGAIESIIDRLQPDPKSLMNANRDHRKLADRVVIHASQNSIEFSRKKLPGKSQAKINRQILRIILEKTLKALEGHADYEAVLVPYFQREVLERFDGHDEKLDAIIARLDKAELKAAENAGIPHSTIIKLAQRINDDVDDPDQALQELESAVEIAISVQQKGRLGSNLDAFVSEVLKRVADLSSEGLNDEASAEVDRAFEQWQERQERARFSGLEILDSGLQQDLLRRDATAAAKRLLQKAEIEYPEQQERFDYLRSLFVEWFNRGSNHGLRLELEISAELASPTIEQANTPAQTGMALNNYATALSELGERAGGEEGQDYLEQAVASYDLALEINTRDAMPAHWAMTQMNRAVALMYLGERTGGEEGLGFLKQAVAGYDLALEIYTRDAIPAAWVKTQMKQANALMQLGNRAGGEAGQDYLEQAVAGYDLALEKATRDAMPAQWALTQMNRAVAFGSLGERAGGEEGLVYLKRAIVGYDLAFEVRTRDAMPADWAMTQMNRAITLKNLGESAAGEEGLDYLEQAVAGYDLALEIRTRDAMPARWAMTHMNRAVAHGILAERYSGEDGQDYYQQAIVGYDLALEVYEELGMEYYADMTHNNRQIAVDALAKLKEG